MSNDEKYPTIERLADLTNTTVGYQKPDLEREAVLCWRELATLRERLADMEQEAIARDAFQTRLKELKYEAEQRAERAEKDAERLDWIESQWTDGIHVEVCAVGIGDVRVERAATVYTSRPNRQYQLGTLRETIDAAMEGN